MMAGRFDATARGAVPLRRMDDGNDGTAKSDGTGKVSHNVRRKVFRYNRLYDRYG